MDSKTGISEIHVKMPPKNKIFQSYSKIKNIGLLYKNKDNKAETK